MTRTRNIGVSTLAVIGLLLIIGLGYTGWTAYKKAQDRAAFAAAVSSANEKLDKAKAQWVDALTIATSTPRIGLAVPITNLQKIRQEVQALDVPQCLSESKGHLVKGMNEGLDGMLTFMRNDMHKYELEEFTQNKAKLMAASFAEYSKKDTACPVKK